jgi:hypothetical protein
MRVRRLATAAAVALVAAAGTAFAQDDICTVLEGQLASLEQGPAADTSNNFRQYDTAITRQRADLDRATVDAQRSGCMGGFLIFQRTPSPKCGPLMASIARMKANLQRLTSARDRYSTDPFEISRRRSEILGALAANRCGAGYPAARPLPPPNGGNFLDMLFGNARQQGWSDRTYAPGGAFGTYRTLCVRKCDGYYFPISFSTVPSRFPTDEQTCQSMCPGADVGLYIYRNPGEEPDQMVSLAGEAYSALPTAFRYRKQYDAACTCRTPADGAPAATAASPANLNPTATGPVAAVPSPLLRSPAGEDPETLANRVGDFSAKAIASRGGDAVAGIADGQRKVRIVGPHYYAEQ